MTKLELLRSLNLARGPIQSANAGVWICDCGCDCGFDCGFDLVVIVIVLSSYCHLIVAVISPTIHDLLLVSLIGSSSPNPTNDSLPFSGFLPSITVFFTSFGRHRDISATFTTLIYLNAW